MIISIAAAVVFGIVAIFAMGMQQLPPGQPTGKEAAEGKRRPRILERARVTVRRALPLAGFRDDPARHGSPPGALLPARPHHPGASSRARRESRAANRKDGPVTS